MKKILLILTCSVLTFPVQAQNNANIPTAAQRSDYRPTASPDGFG